MRRSNRSSTDFPRYGRMKERTRNIIVGLTAIGGLMGLALIILLFGLVPKWIEPSYGVVIELDDATGIATGSRVRLAGVDIGAVDRVQLKTDPSKGVDLYCRIQPKFSITAGSTVTAVAGLLGGSAQIHIDPAPLPADALPRDGTGRIAGHASNVTRDFQKLAERVEANMNVQLARVGQLADRVSALSDEFLAVGKKINGLLEQRSPEDVDAGKAAANVATILARADSGLRELNQTVKSINAIVNDNDLKAGLKDAVAGTKQLTTEARKKLDELSTRYIALADDMSKTLSSATAMLEDAHSGKGTLGKLVGDPSLYNNMQDAAGRLSDALKEMKLLMQKWKAEGLPVHF